MAVYVSLVNFTHEGLKTMKAKGVGRSDMVKKNVESLGGKLLHAYYCLGDIFVNRTDLFLGFHSDGFSKNWKVDSAGGKSGSNQKPNRNETRKSTPFRNASAGQTTGAKKACKRHI